MVLFGDKKIAGLLVKLHMKTVFLAIDRNVDLEQLNPPAVHGDKPDTMALFLEREILHAAKIKEMPVRLVFF